MSVIKANIALANVEANPLSKETGFSSIPFEFSATTSTTIWEAVSLAGTYGTVVVIGNTIAGTTRVAVNGINTTQIIDNETYAISSDPLNSVAITYTTSGSLASTFNVSISASKFAY